MRPVYLDLFRLHLPLTGWVSILHRVTGVLLFLALPAGLYLLQHSLSGPRGYAEALAMLDHPLARLALMLAIVSLSHHVLAGVRHLAMDLHWGLDIKQARLSARLVLAAGLLIALAAGWSVLA